MLSSTIKVLFSCKKERMGNIAPGTHYDPADIAKDYWKLYTERKDVEIVFK